MKQCRRKAGRQNLHHTRDYRRQRFKKSVILPMLHLKRTQYLLFVRSKLFSQSIMSSCFPYMQLGHAFLQMSFSSDRRASRAHTQRHNAGSTVPKVYNVCLFLPRGSRFHHE